MKMNILSVDAMNITKIELSSLLKDYDVNIIGVTNELEALNVLHDGKVDISAIVWTVNFVDELAFSAIKGMKRRGKYKHIPIVVVSKFTDKSHIIRAIEAGASEYIVKPYGETVLLNKMLKTLNLPFRRDEESKTEDIDISLYSFPEMYNKEFKAASRGGYALSILLASVMPDPGMNDREKKDLDGFVETVKKVIKTRMRETDVSFKLGSNVIILLPFTDKKGANVFGEKLKKVFNSHSSIKQQKEGYSFLTISVSFPEDGRIKEKLLEKLEQDFNNYMIQNNIDNKIYLRQLNKY